MPKSKAPRPQPSRKINQAIREALLEAANVEQAKSLFVLNGRGHEPRLTVDRRLAGVLRNVSIPHTWIAGYGANTHYPTRVFELAVQILRKRLGYSPIAISTDSRSAYRTDDQGSE